jgi:hypothetical protein
MVGEITFQNCSQQRAYCSSPGDMWTWRAMVMTMPVGDNSWLIHQSSLAVLPAETSGESRRNGRRSENFAYQYLKYLKGSLTCRKILRHGTSGFTSHRRKVCCGFLSPLKISPLAGLNPRPLGPFAITLTTTPPRREGPTVPIVQEAGWAPEPVWTQRLEEKSLASAGDRTSIARSSSP